MSSGNQSPASDNVQLVDISEVTAREFLDPQWVLAYMELHGVALGWDLTTRHFFGATAADGQLLGAAAYTLADGVGHLEELVVKKGLRRRGIGERLISEFERRCRQAKCHKLILEVEETNLEGQRFYKRQGWEPDGVLRRHWHQHDFQIWIKWLYQ